MSALIVFYFSLPSLQIALLPLFGDLFQPRKYSSPGSSKGTAILAHNLLEEYGSLPQGSDHCSARYQIEYLKDFRDSVTRYCTHESLTQLECFHSRTAADRIDTLCYGSDAIFNAMEHRYKLSCDKRQLSHNDTNRGAPTIDRFSGYWYGTGPKNVLTDAVDFDNEVQLSGSPPERRVSILVKREGEGNLWHCLMELFALSMTIDILRVSINARTQRPYINEEDDRNTRVVLIDGKNDGPYYDLWNLFAKQPTVRLRELAADGMGDIVIPLAGGGNPFWQGDWEPSACERSRLLEVFASRIIAFCNITTSVREGNVQVTWINRIEKRRLIDQDALLEAARAAIPHVDIRSVDFAAMPFCEQVQLIRDTDVLAGVHGAGLTHGMWLRPGSAMAEIQPPSLRFQGFRNLAALLSHAYFAVHGTELPRARRSNWQKDHVAISQERFIALLETSVRGMYKKGIRDFDIV